MIRVIREIRVQECDVRCLRDRSGCSGLRQSVELGHEPCGDVVLEIEERRAGSIGAETSVPEDGLDRRTQSVFLEKSSDGIELGLPRGIPPSRRHERRNHARR